MKGGPVVRLFTTRPPQSGTPFRLTNTSSQDTSGTTKNYEGIGRQGDTRESSPQDGCVSDHLPQVCIPLGRLRRTLSLGSHVPVRFQYLTLESSSLETVGGSLGEIAARL